MERKEETASCPDRNQIKFLIYALRVSVPFLSSTFDIKKFQENNYTFLDSEVHKISSDLKSNAWRVENISNPSGFVYFLIVHLFLNQVL